MTLNARTVYRLGAGMVWLGVLAWVPFIVLRVVGEKTPFWWFLPFHLLGVIGGARLRGLARKAMAAPPVKRNLSSVIGQGLIYAGVLVWVPYFYLKYLAHQPADVMSFLPFHLTGVVGGLLVLGIGLVLKRY